MQPIEIRGKHNTAYVYALELESGAQKQLQDIANHEAFADGRIAVMPDVHAGAGVVIGFTSSFQDKVIPNVIGVDIGCGVKGWNLGKPQISFRDLDNFIRANVPFGYNVHQKYNEDEVRYTFESFYGEGFPLFSNTIKEICKRIDLDSQRVFQSIGSLGGGNHFIEIGKHSETGDYWLVIHSGSRNFGLKVANYHQKKAQQKQGKKGGLEFLEGEDKDQYLADMGTAQQFAELNREFMAELIINYHFQMDRIIDQNVMEFISSTHNYINLEDKVIRKGAISAKKGEGVLIPFNMADGILIGVGKGNPDWNYSAPHGAGRVLSRGKAKEQLSLEDFRHRMDGVWSSCITKSTLDESPMAYKDAKIIEQLISPTVEITGRLKPIYNFKAN